MEWSAEFDLGIEKIDKQHKHIVTAINALENAILKKQTGEMLAKVSKALYGYAHSHFEYEEELLERHGYPSLRQQLEEHSSFILKIKEFDRAIAETDDTQKLGMQICNYLREWLVDHILEKDKRYLTLLGNKGIK